MKDLFEYEACAVNMEIPLNKTSLSKWLVKTGLMDEADVLKDTMKLQAGPTFTLFLISFGCMVDFAVLSDAEVTGQIASLPCNLFRFMFMPLLAMFTLTNFFLVGNTDPGFVGNKRLRAKKEGMEVEVDPMANLLRRTPASRDWLRDGREIPVVEGRRLDLDLHSDYYDYCECCEVNLPLDRSISHCYSCGACIEGLDHHCPWIGQCIGKKNEKYFVRFNIGWFTLLVQLLIVVFLV